jgi:hypothetical protein
VGSNHGCTFEDTCECSSGSKQAYCTSSENGSPYSQHGGACGSGRSFCYSCCTDSRYTCAGDAADGSSSSSADDLCPGRPHCCASSCMWTNDGSCDEPFICCVGTDRGDC